MLMPPSTFIPNTWLIFAGARVFSAKCDASHSGFFGWKGLPFADVCCTGPWEYLIPQRDLVVTGMNDSWQLKALSPSI